MLVSELSNHQIEKICHDYQLGVYKPDSVICLHQGLMHYCWKITTNRGCFVIKHLNHSSNPSYCTFSAAVSDQVNQIFKAEGFTVQILQKTHRHESVLCLPEKSVIVSEWIEGQVARYPFKPVQKETMAKLLAKLHHFSPTKEIVNRPFDLLPSTWQQFWQLASQYLEIDPLKPLAEFVESDVLPYYRAANFSAISSYKLSQRDYRPDNLIWCGEKPVIIDWEMASWLMPGVDLLGTALNWSIDANTCQLDQVSFQDFIKTYNAHANIPIKLDKYIWGQVFLDWLQWLLWCMGVGIRHPYCRSKVIDELHYTLNCLKSCFEFAQKTDQVN